MEDTFIAFERENPSEKELVVRSIAFYDRLNKRRSVRVFSDQPVPKSVINNLILAAGTAPSGAHKQPWTFCAISNPDIKAKIREAAEEEEYENYHGRMSQEWMEDLKQFGTDWRKPFLEVAPWLIVMFRKTYDLEDGKKKKNYYVQESVGIACGMLITAIHEAGLVTLTHTPSPMNFLTNILNRPVNEKPFLLLPVGYASENATVPDLKRKSLEDIAVFFE
ncbi:MAG: iodotyrosine deiodinase [bacterium]|jgi:iodotyrosine deiodinase